MREGLHIECPFRGCDRRFSVLSSFASHLSKKHRNDSVEHVENPSNVGRPVTSESVSQCEPSNVNYSDDDQEVLVAVDEFLFLQNITLFYLKLQASIAGYYNTNYY